MSKIKTNIEIKIEKVNVNLLHSGLAFQRKVTDMKKVKDIASNWDEKLFRNPCVSFRDGMYNVIDGQHTISAYKMRFGNNSEIDCKVVYDLDEKGECEWYYRLEEMSTPQSIKRVYNAKLGAEEENLIALSKDLQSCGLMLGINVCRGKNVVIAIKTMENIHREMQSTNFIACYKLLQETWSGDKDTLKESFLRGIKKFYETYLGIFDEGRFKTALSKVNPKDIKSQADSDIYMKDSAVKYARVMVEHYNKKLKKLPTLKISMLED